MCNQITNAGSIYNYRYIIIVDHGPDKAVSAHSNNCSILKRIKPGQPTVYKREYYGCSNKDCARNTVNTVIQNYGYAKGAGVGKACSRCHCLI